MSNIPYIGGGASVAAEYQDYLARLGARRRAGRDAVSGEKRELRTFDSAIDPDAEPEHDREGASEGEAEGEPAADADGGQHLPIKA